MAMTTYGLAAITTACGTTFYPACATGTGDSAVGDVALTGEITDSGFWNGAARYSGTVTNPTTVSILVSKTYTASGSKTVGSVGVYGASTGNTLWCGKKLSAARSVVSGDSITINYTLTLS